MPYLRENSIILDLNGSPIKTPIYLTPSDVEAYTLNFQIMNGAAPFDITGATITAVFKVPNDETPYVGECTITDAENGLCSYDLPSDIYAVSGTVLAVLRIIKDISQISTCGFLLQVNTTPDESGGVEGSDHYPILLSLIADIQALDFSAKFDGATGHKHTGETGDAPKIGANGIDVGAIGFTQLNSSVMQYIVIDNISGDIFESDVFDTYTTEGTYRFKLRLATSDANYVTAELKVTVQKTTLLGPGGVVVAENYIFYQTLNFNGTFFTRSRQDDFDWSVWYEAVYLDENGKVPAYQLPDLTPTYGRIKVGAEAETGITPSDSVWTKLDWFVADDDPDNYYNTVNQQWVVPEGKSQIEFNANINLWNDTAAPPVEVAIFKVVDGIADTSTIIGMAYSVGTFYAASEVYALGISLHSGILNVSAGDKFEVYYKHYGYGTIYPYALNGDACKCEMRCLK